MKLKHLFEYNLKTQDFPNTKQYEYIETENYIFLKLDTQSYMINDFDDVLSTEESNNYLTSMVIPSKINKYTLIDFFDNNHEYFTRINIKYMGMLERDFNNLKNIFNKNYMGYSDWDLCSSDIDLDYEMKHVLFHNIRHNKNGVVVHQGISFIKTPANKLEVKVRSCLIRDNNIMVYNPRNMYSYPISFIVRRK